MRSAQTCGCARLLGMLRTSATAFTPAARTSAASSISPAVPCPKVWTRTSDPPAIVCPVEQRLALAATAPKIAGYAVFLDRGDVPLDRAPASNLSRVVVAAPSQIIAAVPLKPAARVLRVDPALAAPFTQRLRSIHAEVVELRIVSLAAEFCALEPGC